MFQLAALHVLNVCDLRGNGSPTECGMHSDADQPRTQPLIGKCDQRHVSDKYIGL